MTELALTAAQAEEFILSALQSPSGWEQVDLASAHGRVLAEDLRARAPLPPHDNSAMDGYAVRAVDLAGAAATRLRLVGRSLAGHPFPVALQAGEAVRIMTGAAMPAGADTVVMQEMVSVDGEHVVVPAGQQGGQHVRHAGEDLAAGSLALPRGRRCTSTELGLIAALGITAVKVRRRLRVALFSSGDELVDCGQPPGSGQIYDSNRHSLAARLRQLGCEVSDLGIVVDRRAALEAVLDSAAASADVVISSGGIAVGDADHVRHLLAARGEVSFLRLAIKPGQRMAFGRCGNAVLFALPGNPAAAQVVFLQFVRPALLKLMGVDPLPLRAQFRVRADFSLARRAGRREFLRGRLGFDGNGPSVSLAGAQGSAMLHSLAGADCLIVIDEACTAVAHGDEVTVQPFNELP